MFYENLGTLRELGLSRAYLFPTSFLDRLEILVNSLSCVLSGFPALSNMSEVVLALALSLAVHSNGLFNSFWLWLGLWLGKSRVFLLKYLRILARSKLLAT